MIAQEKYNKIIDKIEELVNSRSKEYFESALDLKKAGQEAFEYGECGYIDDRSKSEIFKFLTGFTLSQYINQRVMMKAYKTLIEQENYNIDEIINIVGVSGEPALYKKFKEIFHMTPKEAYERKIPGLYVNPSYWENVSDAGQEMFARIIEVPVEVVKTNKKPIVFISIVALIIFGILTGFIIKANKEPDNKYNKAMTLYETREYEEARKLFAELGDYRNSQEMINKCIYEEAEDSFSNRDYFKAAELWFKISEYSDSIEKSEEAINRIQYLLSLDGEYVLLCYTYDNPQKPTFMYDDSISIDTSNMIAKQTSEGEERYFFISYNSEDNSMELVGKDKIGHTKLVPDGKGNLDMYLDNAPDGYFHAIKKERYDALRDQWGGMYQVLTNYTGFEEIYAELPGHRITIILDEMYFLYTINEGSHTYNGRITDFSEDSLTVAGLLGDERTVELQANGKESFYMKWPEETTTPGGYKAKFKCEKRSSAQDIIDILYGQTSNTNQSNAVNDMLEKTYNYK